MSLTKTELRTDWFKPTPFTTHDVLPSELMHNNEVTKKDIISFVKGEITKLRSSLEENKKKIGNLMTLFNVVRGGNNISTTHQIVFNQSGNVGNDNMSSTLLDQFVADYGLNLGDVHMGIIELEHTLEELERAPTKEFCEVDLFDKELKPVEC